MIMIHAMTYIALNPVLFLTLKVAAPEKMSYFSGVVHSFHFLTLGKVFASFSVCQVKKNVPLRMVHSNDNRRAFEVLFKDIKFYWQNNQQDVTFITSIFMQT